MKMNDAWMRIVGRDDAMNECSGHANGLDEYGRSRLKALRHEFPADTNFPNA